MWTVKFAADNTTYKMRVIIIKKWNCFFNNEKEGLFKNEFITFKLG